MKIRRNTVIILAPGNSLDITIVERCEASRFPIFAVTSAADLTSNGPDVLVAQDAEWWKANTEAQAWMGGRCYSAQSIAGVHHMPTRGVVHTGLNSGALAIELARQQGASRALLVGFDMHGDHFFGKYAAPLSNTTPERFEMFKKQFEQVKRVCDKSGMRVVNCTPGSALECFERGDLETELCAPTSN